MSVNKVILLGNVGNDPKVRYIQSRPIASFSLATSEPAKTSPQGVQIPERTEWHNLILWDANAEFAEKYIRSGTRLYVEGKLRHRTWQDRNTIKHNITEIYVDYFEILSR